MSLEEEILQPTFRNQCHRAIVNVLYTYHWLVDHIRAVLQPLGITVQQYNILRILRGQHPRPLSIQGIQRRMLDKSSDVSRLITRLLSKQLVSRTEDPTDRRRKEIRITQRGLQLLQQLDPKIEAIEHLCHRLSPTEIQQLNTLLDKLRG